MVCLDLKKLKVEYDDGDDGGCGGDEDRGEDEGRKACLNIGKKDNEITTLSISLKVILLICPWCLILVKKFVFTYHFCYVYVRYILNHIHSMRTFKE